MTVSEQTSGRRVLTGKIVSDKMDKTVVVEVTRRVLHAKYRKYINLRKTFKAHDETNEFVSGDVVQIRESRPLSRSKRWVVLGKADA